MSSAIELETWYAALGAQFGVIVETSDPERAKQKLYKLRADSRDVDLDCLSIVTSPTNPSKDLWIVRTKPNEA